MQERDDRVPMDEVLEADRRERERDRYGADTEKQSAVSYVDPVRCMKDLTSRSPCPDRSPWSPAATWCGWPQCPAARAGPRRARSPVQASRTSQLRLRRRRRRRRTCRSRCGRASAQRGPESFVRVARAATKTARTSAPWYSAQTGPCLGCRLSRPSALDRRARRTGSYAPLRRRAAASLAAARCATARACPRSRNLRSRCARARARSSSGSHGSRLRRRRGDACRSARASGCPSLCALRPRAGRSRLRAGAYGARPEPSPPRRRAGSLPSLLRACR